MPAACVEPPAQPTDPNVVMIFDTSLSMRLPVSLTLPEELRLRGGRPDGPTEGTLTALMEQSGEKRLDVARRSAADILRRLPPKVRFGLVLFGRGVDAPPGPLPHADACDVTALPPVPGPDRPRHAEALRSFPPRAWTPIARSLEESSAMLSTVDAQKDSHILLITDGLESCHRDPCAEAKRLKARYPNARVHVIDIMGAEQLACIAQETGGEILRSNDPVEIAQFALAIVDPSANCPK